MVEAPPTTTHQPHDAPTAAGQELAEGLPGSAPGPGRCLDRRVPEPCPARQPRRRDRADRVGRAGHARLLLRRRVDDPRCRVAGRTGPQPLLRLEPGGSGLGRVPPGRCLVRPAVGGRGDRLLRGQDRARPELRRGGVPRRPAAALHHALDGPALAARRPGTDRDLVAPCPGTRRPGACRGPGRTTSALHRVRLPGRRCVRPRRGTGRGRARRHGRGVVDAGDHRDRPHRCGHGGGDRRRRPDGAGAQAPLLGAGEPGHRHGGRARRWSTSPDPGSTSSRWTACRSCTSPNPS